MGRYTVFHRACALLLAVLLAAGGCSEDNPASPAKEQASAAPADRVYATDPAEPPLPASTSQAQTQFNIGNKSYLFDVSDHTYEELEALLQRAAEISQLQPENYDQYDQLDIVMILHGPDIDWFTLRNYEQNRRLVDLAARLDAFEIIDMKVCETVMDMRGVRREEIPSFIEPVPYAPDEIKRLLNEGYINL